MDLFKELKATKPISQERQILMWLQAGNSLTAYQALNMFGCLRLSGRIYDLRWNKGYNKISSPNCYIPYPAEMVKIKSGKWIAKYKLIQNEQ